MLPPETLSHLTPSSNSKLPKVRQLYLALYQAIIDGELPYHSRLPASRELAKHVGVGRNTVVAVYNQLCDEGLLQSNGRLGTTVLHQRASRHTTPRGNWTLSHFARSFEHSGPRQLPLSPGQPDTTLFPQDAWRRALQKAARLKPADLAYQRVSMSALQQSIARYLASYRSLVVNPEQIVVTASTRQSLLLAATLFANPNDIGWIETPGYTGAVDAFRQSGMQLVACPVDESGMTLPSYTQAPALIYTTPCFQYPSGVPLAADRRDQLLALSANHNSVIFEDDYDSEFRDSSQPRPALAAAAGTARVLHAGTFSKLMFPAVRVAWLVVPPEHAGVAHRCLKALGGGHNTIAQAAVAELLDNGTLSSHLQRARQIYAKRREGLLQTVASSKMLASSSENVGSLNLVLNLAQAVDRAALEQALFNNGVGPVPLERMM